MKRFLFFCAVLCVCIVALLGLATPVAAQPPQPPTPNYVPGEVMIKLHLAADLPAVAAQYGLDATTADQFGSRPIYLLRITDGVAPPNKAAQLRADGRVVAADPNYVGVIPEAQQRTIWAGGGTAGEYEAQWAGVKMKLDRAHTVATGAGQTVAILDTGIDATHPALAAQIVPGFDFVDFDNDPSEVGVAGQDFGFGHGTHVAGLVSLVAPDAQLMPIRILEPDGSGNIWVLMEGFKYAVEQGVDVVNLSFSFPIDSQVFYAMAYSALCADDNDDDDLSGSAEVRGEDHNDDYNCLNFEDVVVVAAAGNRGGNVMEFPAAAALEFKGVIAVGASTTTDQLAAFSSYGSWTKIGAPGDRILSTVPGGQYATWSGTSMSTPLVAGTAALVGQRYPNYNAENIVKKITDTGVRLNHNVIKKQVNAAAAVGVR